MVRPRAVTYSATVKEIIVERDRAVVRSPIDGRVLKVLARAGEVDAPLGIITPENAPAADRGALDEVGRAFDMISFVEVRPAADIPEILAGGKVASERTSLRAG